MTQCTARVLRSVRLSGMDTMFETLDAMFEYTEEHVLDPALLFYICR